MIFFVPRSFIIMPIPQRACRHRIINIAFSPREKDIILTLLTEEKNSLKYFRTISFTILYWRLLMNNVIVCMPVLGIRYILLN